MSIIFSVSFRKYVFSTQVWSILDTGTVLIELHAKGELLGSSYKPLASSDQILHHMIRWNPNWQVVSQMSFEFSVDLTQWLGPEFCVEQVQSSIRSWKVYMWSLKQVVNLALLTIPFMSSFWIYWHCQVRIEYSQLFRDYFVVNEADPQSALCLAPSLVPCLSLILVFGY
jgi:hypothetical protein